MEHAVRLDGQRLMAVLEATVRDLELLATLPDQALVHDDQLPPSARAALHRQVSLRMRSPRLFS